MIMADNLVIVLIPCYFAEPLIRILFNKSKVLGNSIALLIYGHMYQLGRLTMPYPLPYPLYSDGREGRK